MEIWPLDLPTLSVATATAMHGLPWCPHLESQITMIDSSHVFSITRVTLTATATVAIDYENETHKKAFTRKDLVEGLVQVKDCWGQRCSLCKFSFSTDDDDGDDNDDDDVTDVRRSHDNRIDYTQRRGFVFLWRFIRYGIPGMFYWPLLAVCFNTFRCLCFSGKKYT